MIRAHSNSAAYQAEALPAARRDEAEMPAASPPVRVIDAAVAQATTGRRTVSIIQAQALCQVSRRTIYNWLHQGKVEYVRNAGGAVRIFADTLFRDPAPRVFSWTR
jgi:excisionase family DNA binding protein